jgi:Zn-finger protein
MVWRCPDCRIVHNQQMAIMAMVINSREKWSESVGAGRCRSQVDGGRQSLPDRSVE